MPTELIITQALKILQQTSIKRMFQNGENGKVEPRMDTVRLIASTFEVSPNYLIGMSDEPYFNANNKEDKDIQKDLQKMIEQLENGLYSKETAEYSEETRELIIASLEQAVKIARMEAKNKFTPKKYKG